jgi:hypothetical protein
MAAALVLPAVVFAGLSARHPHPKQEDRSIEIPALLRLAVKTSDGWKNHAINTSVYVDGSTPHGLTVLLHPRIPLNEPDVLVYWSRVLPAGASLPESAKLIGRLLPERLSALPRDADQGSYLLLYSLGQGVVTDSFQLEKLP